MSPIEAYIYVIMGDDEAFVKNSSCKRVARSAVIAKSVGSASFAKPEPPHDSGDKP